MFLGYVVQINCQQMSHAIRYSKMCKVTAANGGTYLLAF
jgi:hypothetical protein